MKMKQLIWVLLLFFSIPTWAQEQALTDSTPTATDIWSLDRCVAYALENNISIQQQALSVDYSENQLKQSKIDRAPTVNASVGHYFQFGRSLTVENTWADINSQNTSFSLDAGVVLYNGMQKKNTKEQYEFNVESALKDLEKAKDDISLAVAQAYLQILFNKELVATQKEQLKLTEEQIKISEKQVQAGTLPKGQVLETMAQQASEELTLTNYENQLDLSLLDLMQLLEVEVSRNFDIEIPNMDAEALAADLLSSNEVYAKALEERPEILSYEFQLKSMEAQQKIAKGALYPSLSMGVSYGSNYNNQYTDLTGEKIPFGEQISNQKQTLVYFSLNIPIFNGWSAKTSVANAELNMRSAQNELQVAKNSLMKEIQQAYVNALAAMKKYQSSEKAVESTEEAFRYVEEKFNLGIVTSLEYTDAKNKVTNAQSSFIQAKYEYIFSVKILDFYNGKPITFN